MGFYFKNAPYILCFSGIFNLLFKAFWGIMTKHYFLEVPLWQKLLFFQKTTVCNVK
ncbi:hypothetical protein STRDD12_00015 [Streptococcus sp. DD12]|nr:hypothetical protein STRDD12_00015 [Streptococcus sp. DD12]